MNDLNQILIFKRDRSSKMYPAYNGAVRKASIFKLFQDMERANLFRDEMVKASQLDDIQGKLDGAIARRDRCASEIEKHKATLEEWSKAENPEWDVAAHAMKVGSAWEHFHDVALRVIDQEERDLNLAKGYLRSKDIIDSNGDESEVWAFLMDHSRRWVEVIKLREMESIDADDEVEPVYN